MPFLVPLQEEIVTKVEPTIYNKLMEEEKRKANMLMGVYQRLSPEEKIILGQNPEFQKVMKKHYPTLIKPADQFGLYDIPQYTPEAGLQAETNIQEALIREAGAKERLQMQLNAERDNLQEKFIEMKNTYEEMLRNPSEETRKKLEKLDWEIKETQANINRIKAEEGRAKAGIGEAKARTIEIQDKATQPTKSDLSTKNAIVLLDDILATNPNLSFKDVITQMPSAVVTGADLSKLKVHYDKLTKKKPAKKVEVKPEDVKAIEKEFKTTKQQAEAMKRDLEKQAQEKIKKKQQGKK